MRVHRYPGALHARAERQDSRFKCIFLSRPVQPERQSEYRIAAIQHFHCRAVRRLQAATGTKPAVTLGSPTLTGAPEQPGRNGMGPMGARLSFVVPVSIGLFSGTECALAQSAPDKAEVLPPIVVSRTTPNAKPGGARNAPRTVRAPTPTPTPTLVPPMERSLIPALCPISPTAARHSPIHVQ
jgi:hypothetical protein